MPEPETKSYVVAMKRQLSAAPPLDLQEAVNSVDGVQMRGAYSGRAQVDATPEGIEALRSKIGDWFHIEETAERGLP